MGIGLPFGKLPKAELVSGLEKLKNGAKKLKNQLKLTSEKGFEKNPLFYFGAFLAISAVILTFAREQNNALLLAAISKSQDQEVLPSAFLGAKTGFLRQTPDLLLIGESGVLSAAPPLMVSPQTLGAFFLTVDPQDQKKVVREYIIEEGDTLSFLAEEFNVSVDTLLWANNLNKSSVLKAGQKLVIPPVSGIIHHVKDKDTLSGIAETYKARMEDIIAFNELSEQGQIYIGDIIIVPGGVMPPASVGLQAPAQIPVASTQFISPVISPYIITQGLHWYNAVDLSYEGYACGKPVVASAEGRVQRVVWSRTGYGNYVTILHSNGVVTLYAHLGGIFVSSRDQVSQGAIIGLIGNSGHTHGPTGCHVHFEVRGARNPFAR